MHSDDDLLAAVDRAFAVTGAGTPGWPDPHPFGTSPREEEYSRVLDPGKYRILQTRLDAWAEALTVAGLAQVEVDGLVRRFVPSRPGALILLVETTIVDGAPYGVEVRISDGTTALLARLPFCGCDACDDGSEQLLEELDGWIRSVVRGGIVHAQGPGGSVSRTTDGAHGAGLVAITWLDDQLPAPDGVRRWVGTPWR